MPTNGRRKLLLADDSPTVQKVVSLTFDDEGFQVVTVGTGEQALAELARDVPDVVLADVHMPAPDGYELCARIKRDERTRGVPVMLLVGAFEPFDEAEARKCGADEVLTKPFQSIRELVNKVGGLLGGHPEAKPSDAAAKADETTHALRAVAPDETRAVSHDEVERDAPTVAASGNDAPSSFAAARPAFADPVMDDEDIETVPAAEFDARDAARSQVSAPPTQSFAASAAGTDTARSYPQTFDARSAAAAAADDALLELGDLDLPRARTSTAQDDFVLDFDEAEADAPSRADSGDARAYASDAQVYTEDAPSAVEMQAAGSMSMAEPAAAWIDAEEFAVSPGAVTEPVEAPAPAAEASFASFKDAPRQGEATTSETETSAVAGATQLSPETIDAIARRVVEHLSDRVVREIAWEVVPDLAERLIRRKLEEEQTRAQ
ncbi:MAG: PleD family two-component system response regulator [Pyrinomonadaceae bacterium]